MHALHRLTQHGSIGLLCLRLTIAAVFLFHGIQKWSVWGMADGGQMPASMVTLLKILSIAEPLGALGLFFGLLTQLAALGLSLIMLGAIYFKQYVWMWGFASMEHTGWEFDLVILGGLLALLFLGAGMYSLDAKYMKK